LAKKNSLLSFLASVKLAVALLIVVAAVSILGTLIPQQDASGPFLARMNPGIASVLLILQLDDVFHSAWFAILMALLALNLIVCSLDRFPRAWRRFRQQGDPERRDVFENLPADLILAVDASPAAAAHRIETLLKKRVGSIKRRETGGQTCLFAQKGAFSHLGVFIVHAGVLIMMAGVMAGPFLGFEGHMNIPEGESSAVVALKGKRGFKNLDFAVRCDRFIMDFYDDGTPKTYRSDLTFLEQGREVQTATVLVNHPVSFGGIRFYQASYGTMPTGDPSLEVIRGDRKVMEVKIAAGKTFPLPESKALVQVLRVEDNFMDMGPAVKLNIDAPGGVVQFWVFAAIDRIAAANPGLLEQVPLFNPASFAPYVFSLTKPEIRPYTGLQAVRDPGVPVVALGAAFLMAGLYLVFFRSHRQIWIRLEARAGKTMIRIAGKSSRNQPAMDRELHNLIKAMGFDRKEAS
jgi:cytochrome c biogenesis protein